MQFGVNGLKHSKPLLASFNISQWIHPQLPLFSHYCQWKDLNTVQQQQLSVSVSLCLCVSLSLCLLLDVALLDSFFVQVFYELLPLHPVDERADVTAVAKKGPARQVQSTSCKDRRRCAVTLNCPARKSLQSQSMTRTTTACFVVMCIHKSYTSILKYTHTATRRYLHKTHLKWFLDRTCKLDTW